MTLVFIFINFKASRSLQSPSISQLQSMEGEVRPRRRMSKMDSLKPILNMLESQLLSHGVQQLTANHIVQGHIKSLSWQVKIFPSKPCAEIAERLVTAGYGWDKILNYHSKGEDIFLKKLIPHVYMSKDDFPPSLSPHHVLEKMFVFMEDWKCKLYDMISFNSLHPPTDSQVSI